MSLCRRLLIGLVLVAFRAEAEDFPLGIVARNAEVEFSLSVASIGDVAGATAITTDCDCLTPLAATIEAPGQSKTLLRFKYRSPHTGRIRVNVWRGGDSAKRPILCTVTGYVYDPSWLTTAEAAQRDARTVIVDTRWPQQYARVHIPASLNISEFAVKSHNELRSGRIVLVDAGFAPTEQLALVEALRADGFRDVVCLMGGIRSWLKSGGASEGTAPEPLIAAATITPAEFSRGETSARWSMVSLPGDGASGFGSTPKDVDAVVSAFGSAPNTGALATYVLVVADDAARYARTERALIGSQASRVFYLAGGHASLDAFRIEQRSLVARPAGPFQTHLAAGRPLIGSGCASCPKR